MPRKKKQKKGVKRLRKHERFKQLIQAEIDFCKKNPRAYPKSMVSFNSKTGFSFNRGLANCFGATDRCMDYCYVLVGRYVFGNVKEAMFRRENFIRDHSPSEIATRFSMEIPYGIDFRWFGSGELCKKLTEAINILVEKRGDARHYVYTKRIGLATQLDDRVMVNFSLDRSSPDFVVDKLRSLNKKNFNITYVSDEVGDIPEYIDFVDVIHPDHRVKSKKRAIMESLRDYHGKVCDFAFDDSIGCSRCRRCIDVPRPNRPFPV